MLLQALLAFKVPLEKESVLFYPLCVACFFFSLVALTTLSLVNILSVLSVIYHGTFFSGLVYMVFCVFPACVWVFLYFGDVSFYDLGEDLVYAIDLEFFSPIYA